MEKTLKSIKDCSSIYYNGGNVLIKGRNLRVLRTDGSLVCWNKEIGRPLETALLPGNMALVDSTAKKAFYYISLDTGEVVWSVKHKERIRFSTRFIVAPDGMTVYDLYYRSNSNTLYIDAVNPTERSLKTYVIKDTLRTSPAGYCDEEGVLHILQTHSLFPGDPRYTPEKPSLFAVLRVKIENDGVETTWEREWMDHPKATAWAYDGRYTLYTGLKVYDHETGEWIDLLENDTRPKPYRQESFFWSYDPDNCYLTVSLFGVGVELIEIIDCKNRVRVAQYARPDSSVGFMGCLINGEYWHGTKDGIVKKPFPYFEEQ